MLEIDRLITILKKISPTNTGNRSHYIYLDNINLMKKNEPDFFQPDEVLFLGKILQWDINTDEKTWKDRPLLLMLVPGHEKKTTSELLNLIFSTDDLASLISLNDSQNFNDSDILSRINDILFCSNHTSLKRRKREFAKRAILFYLDSIEKKFENEDSLAQIIRNQHVIAMLLRASNITCVIHLEKEDPIFTRLISLIKLKLDLKDTTDDTAKLLQALINLDSNFKPEALKITKKILDDNHPILKMKNIDYLISYYNFLKHHEKDNAVYSEKKIDCLLWIVDWENQRGHYPMALDHSIQAENELKQLRCTPQKRKELTERIQEKKKQNSKMPDGLQWHYHSIEIPNYITEILNRAKNMTFLETFKTFLIDFKNINYKDTQESLGIFLRSSTLLTPNENGALTHDKKPKSIKYSDSELVKIFSLQKTTRDQICIKIKALLNSTKDRNNTSENDFSILEKYLKVSHLEERKKIIIKSIRYAISGDMCIALHLIIPQVEEFFRKFLQSAGIATSIFTSENNHEELTITQIFNKEENAEIIIKEYGHDVFCEFYLLLLDKRCGNYRNQLCHGIMNDDDFDKNEAVYVWGFCLYMIFKKFLFTEYSQFTIAETTSNEQ